MPFDFANLANVTYLEKIFQDYQRDPKSVDPTWFHFFEGMRFAETHPPQGVVSEGPSDLRIQRLIEIYRRFGHFAVNINPIRLADRERPKEFELAYLGFQESDLKASFPTLGVLQNDQATLKEIIAKLEEIYCTRIAYEVLHCTSFAPKIFTMIEENGKRELSSDEKKAILTELNHSEILESFIHMKYPGQKRFSVEGGETLIPMMREMIEKGGEFGVEDYVLGMAHRGRLNVLANLLGKSYAMIFREFEGSYIPATFEGSGDVKYHMGYEADVQTRSGNKIHLSLASNPSHLEAVDPIVEGQTLATQIMKTGGDSQKVVPVLIHGDASVAGQGVIYETLQLSKIEGYSTGGTIHIIINNQVGFTASPHETKSMTYSSDIGKAFEAPIFHVNAEDPEACVRAMHLAQELRQKFHSDVFIELNCYRKYGHNEGDEPSFTQPKSYQKIREKSPIRDLYLEKLIREGVLRKEEAEQLEKSFRDKLEEALHETQKALTAEKQPSAKPRMDFFTPVETALSEEALKDFAQKITTCPDEFKIHPKLRRILQERLKMVMENTGVDWGMAEQLAYAALLSEGHSVRISGQDSARGTFSHRHAVLVEQETEEKRSLLRNCIQQGARFDVYNSPLSEYAVMGFEYGYTLGAPKTLVIWEAQFGDFANGATIIIDQFIAASEQKWGVHSNLVLFLPHGYEGMGPEHSSARIERYLQLCANENMEVVIPSTSGQFFHLIRRQAKRSFRKPLIVFTPKALLRYPPSLSEISTFTEGKFETLLDDPQKKTSVRRVLLCAGKVYYELLQEQEKLKRQDLAMVRVEQFYPFDVARLNEILASYPGCQELFWVQEEPQNMGGWAYMQPLLREVLSDKIQLKYVGRKRGASTAAGSMALHKKELQEFLDEAFAE